VSIVSESALQAHVRAIEGCNQRGRRMLSLVDLLEAGTVDLSLAAYLAAAMRSGASLLVGARPGGAGKSTVMCALINFLPDDTVIRLPQDGVIQQAGGPAVRRGAMGHRSPVPGSTCYLAHEIGAGHYYAYIWGEEVRAFFRLAAQGHIVVTNLHADTLDETRRQICHQNGVAPSHLDAVALKVFLRMRRARGWSIQRRVSHVYESDGSGDRLTWTGEENLTFTRVRDSSIVSRAEEEDYAGFLSELLAQGVRDVASVRRGVLQRTELPARSGREKSQSGPPSEEPASA
jgi:hypothetical protein